MRRSAVGSQLRSYMIYSSVTLASASACRSLDDALFEFEPLTTSRPMGKKQKSES